VKIGLIIYGSLDTVSGGFLYDRKVVEHLRSSGDTVEIYTLPWRSYPRHLLDNLSHRLIQDISASRLDVLLQDELNHPSLLALNRMLRSRRRIPIVSVVHHLRCDEYRPAIANRVYAWVEGHYLRSVDGFVFNSETTRGRVCAQLAAAPKGIVAYPAADHLHPPPSEWIAENAARKYATARRLNVLFVGNVIERKGLHLLIPALARLPSGMWHLDVAGSLSVAPRYVSAIRDTICSAGIAGEVTLHGAVTDDALRQLLAHADILAVPSYEGFGIVYLEAMSYGVPVIATTTGAAHEVVTHGANGYLVPPQDAVALSAVLAHCALDRGSLLALGRAARERYDRHPTWRQSAETIRVWLHELIRD
jgi:glycosyltransferase involved in cell wall biosynthesis